MKVVAIFPGLLFSQLVFTNGKVYNKPVIINEVLKVNKNMRILTGSVIKHFENHSLGVINYLFSMSEYQRK